MVRYTRRKRITDHEPTFGMVLILRAIRGAFPVGFIPRLLSCFLPGYVPLQDWEEWRSPNVRSRISAFPASGNFSRDVKPRLQGRFRYALLFRCGQDVASYVSTRVQSGPPFGLNEDLACADAIARV